MEPVVILVGALAEALAWVVVVRDRRSIWRTLLPVLGLMGAAALVTGSVRTSPLSRACAVTGRGPRSCWPSRWCVE